MSSAPFSPKLLSRPSVSRKRRRRTRERLTSVCVLLVAISTSPNSLLSSSVCDETPMSSLYQWLPQAEALLPFPRRRTESLSLSLSLPLPLSLSLLSSSSSSSSLPRSSHSRPQFSFSNTKNKSSLRGKEPPLTIQTQHDQKEETPSAVPPSLASNHRRRAQGLFPDDSWFMWYHSGNNYQQAHSSSSSSSSSTTTIRSNDGKHSKFPKHLKPKAEKSHKCDKKFKQMAYHRQKQKQQQNPSVYDVLHTRNDHHHPTVYDTLHQEHGHQHPTVQDTLQQTERRDGPTSESNIDLPPTPSPVATGYRQRRVHTLYETTYMEWCLGDNSYSHSNSDSNSDSHSHETNDGFPARIPAPNRPTPAPISYPWSDPVPPSNESNGHNNIHDSNNYINDSNTNPSSTENDRESPPSPWEDGEEPEVDVEVGDPSSGVPMDADGLSPLVTAEKRAGFCRNVRDKNHASIIAQQETGTTGPSFLFSVPVSVVYAPALARVNLVLASLGNLNVPIALAVTGCPQEESSLGAKRSLEQSSSIVVEYTEMEAWQELTSSGETVDLCASQAQEGASCGLFRSRLIVFLLKQAGYSDMRRSDVEEVLVDRIYKALGDYKDLVIASTPGILALEVGRIEELYIVQEDEMGETAGASSAEESINGDGGSTGTANGISSNISGFALSKNATTIIGSVSACASGLFLGLIFIVWWRKSRPYDSTRLKHSQLLDDDDDMWVDEDQWPAKDGYSRNGYDDDKETTGDTMILTPVSSMSIPSPRNFRNSSSNIANNIDFDLNSITEMPPPRRRRQQQPPGVLPQDRFFPGSSRAPPEVGNHRGRRLNRVDNLLDQTGDSDTFQNAFHCPKPDNPFSPDAFSDGGGSFYPSCGSVPPNDFSCGVVGTTLDTAYHTFSPFSSQSLSSSQQRYHDSKPCSSPTCTHCEHKRSSGIRSDEFLWLRSLLPPSPEKVPSYDPNRQCLCSDTVQL